jgi:hypothetical protein
MEIERYSFGKIRIDGRDYDADVIVSNGDVHSPWWRQEGHALSAEDLRTLMREPPDVLVIGTGYFGRMRVSPETLALLRRKGIDARVARTSEAVEAFNRLQRESARVAAALHLTC